MNMKSVTFTKTSIRLATWMRIIDPEVAIFRTVRDPLSAMAIGLATTMDTVKVKADARLIITGIGSNVSEI